MHLAKHKGIMVAFCNHFVQLLEQKIAIALQIIGFFLPNEITFVTLCFQK